MKTTTLAAILAAAATTGLAAQNSYANLLSNPGFETQGSGDSTTAADWTYFPNQGSIIERDSTDPHTGAWDLHVVVTSIQSFGNAQSFNLSSAISPNTSYSLSYWLLNNNNNGSDDFPHEGAVNAFVDFFTSGGTMISRKLLSNVISSPEGEYVQYVDSITSPANAAFADVYLDVAAGSSQDAGTMNVRFDDINLDGAGINQLPEPASLSILGVSAVGLLLRRKQR